MEYIICHRLLFRIGCHCNVNTWHIDCQKSKYSLIIIQLSLKSSQVFKLRVLCWSPRRKNGKTATIFKVMEATIYAEGCYTIHVNSFKNFLSSIGELGLFEQQRLKDKAQNYSRCEILLFFSTIHSISPTGEPYAYIWIVFTDVQVLAAPPYCICNQTYIIEKLKIKTHSF